MQEKDAKKETPKTKILEVNPFNWKVPECCLEGWVSCPHVAKKQKPSKRNVGV